MFLAALHNDNARMVGFNNEWFDYPVIHFMLETTLHGVPITVEQLYDRAFELINASKDTRYLMMVWPSNRYIEQLDLYKIHHFDNVAKRTRLKDIEFARRSTNIQDLPFEPNTFIPEDKFDELIVYNDHDVDETEGFYLESLEMIEFREQLTEKNGRYMMNHNDTKIGKDTFVMELERHNKEACFHKVNGQRVPRQTKRPFINIGEIIFPYVRFEHPDLQRIHQHLMQQTITETKGIFKGLHAIVDNFKFVFGTGGLHASVPPQVVCSDDEALIRDVDVTSYYPSLAIENGLYPEHLGALFCDIYRGLKTQRVGYAKGTAENKMLKLALNGTYGASNDVYSPFFDPKFTMGITINGQLLLCMLSEQLMKIPGLRMIQANTDGVTFKCPHNMFHNVDAICQWWQEITHLQLEDADYSRMFIRDVNNYIAEYTGGKLKQKGAYETKREWHKNHSMLVVPKAAKAALVDGITPRDFIHSHTDIFDFMIRAKVNSRDKLVQEINSVDYEQQRVTRYLITKTGHPLYKIMPPLARTPDKIRRNAINKGYRATICNDTTCIPNDPIDLDFYIKEAHKLVDPLINGGK